jgi:chromosome segregation ATPase
MATIKADLSPYQISQLRETFERVKMQLSSARARVDDKQSVLSEVLEKEKQAKRLLSLTEGLSYCARERDEARDLLAECARRRAQLEPVLANFTADVSRREAELAQIDTSSLRQHEEIENLAFEMRRSPVR